MTIEGVTGYGYSSQGNVGQDNAPRGVEADAEHGANDGAQAGAQADDHAEDVAQDASYDVPGYEASSATCFKRAADIAKSLNHTNLTSDHLMLALTMDANARRLLERLGDVTQFREAAMQRLGHYGSARNTSEQSSTPTSDLADIAKKAREAANEREQAVALSDLINAFPKLDGRLLYGSADSSKAIALMERIETGLVPRVAESMNRIQAVVTEAMQQNQTVQKMLQDLSSKQTYEAEQRQIAFMEDIRRQVREAVDTQVGAALKQFGDDLIRKLDEVTATEPEGPDESTQTQPEPEPPVTPRSKTNPLSWLGLV